VVTKLVLGCGALAVSALVFGAPANAAGCGGYVNLAVWGCAPWDHNPPKRGVTPGYPAAKPAPIPQPARPVAPIVQRGGQVISNDGGSFNANRAGIITHDGGSLIGNAGGTMRR
jgi:hypothetical protein